MPLRAQRSRCLGVLLVGVPVSLFLYSCRLTLRTQHLPPPLQPSLPASRRQSVTLSDGTLTFPLNLSRYEAEFPHLQHHPCRAVIAEAGVCRHVPGPPLLLLAVKSHPASSGRRAALRRTWARPGEAGGFRLQPLFLMAMTPDARHLRLVQRESSDFGDVVLWDFLESHHNLSLKERCFLQWLHRHCQQAVFVFKGDDDLFMNPEALAGYLRHLPNASLFIHGNIQRHSAVMRRGKYGVSRTLYPLDHYPHFASGGGFVLPGSSLPALYQASLQLPVFPLDDVYLGFLVLAAGLPFSHDERFRVWGAPKDEPEVFRESFTVHGVTPERMEEVWKGLGSPHRSARPGALDQGGSPRRQD
ncbi:PREDICTED: N-acetyllactosaminide beta-1,3-N-acetylglucosaminyltransferase 3-like [Gekko japonicus]|uniref:Hexosyltransferase n=1 Tax=Gekko japonicus TaxID=146911 RepID=A0ABM1LBN5_GEKJA|nr:PREDICTED: N-acetyllactosaminide beta-1,3-N-acetylglucosaminyltransferase 3-like [Gekko japonicus]